MFEHFTEEDEKKIKKPTKLSNANGSTMTASMTNEELREASYELAKRSLKGEFEEIDKLLEKYHDYITPNPDELNHIRTMMSNLANAERKLQTTLSNGGNTGHDAAQVEKLATGCTMPSAMQ